MTEGHGMHTDVEASYPDYLRDESRRVGTADSISFPLAGEEISEHMSAAVRRGETVTIQGARTGITGGAVPQGGHVLNLSRMTRTHGLRHDPVSGDFFITVEPGVVLGDFRTDIAAKSFDTEEWSPESLEALDLFRAAGYHFFAPDPTEATASIGGMAACNASGARSFRYGPTRSHVEGLSVVLASGDSLVLQRGTHRARGRSFSVTTASGKTLAGDIPSYEMPDVKNAAGYFARDDMDLVDLFIGSEGTLGVLAGIELRLGPAPTAMWGVTTFLPSEDAAVRFVREVRGADSPPAAIEFYDCRALNLLREQKKNNPAFEHIPQVHDEWHTGVYLEYHGPGESVVEEAVGAMSEMMQACGGDEDATWLAGDEREMERLRDFRHAVPEAVNLLIDGRRKKEPRLTKLGTDLAVPDAQLEPVMAMYHAGLDGAGLEYVMFGHIGDNHVHVNILPNNIEEYERGRSLYAEWAEAVVGMGGTVSAEHGIGKLKPGLLKEMYGDDGIAEMKALKEIFDPDWRLNPGNLFGRS